MLRVNRAEAILHQCHQCQGHYRDGKVDCENVSCPLYTFMPYRTREPDTACFRYNPRYVGQRSKIEISLQHEGRVPGFLKSKLEQESSDKWDDLLD